MSSEDYDETDYLQRLLTSLGRLRRIESDARNMSNSSDIQNRARVLIDRLESVLARVAVESHYPETEGSVRIGEIIDEELARDILELGLHPDDFIHLFTDEYNYDVPKELYQGELPPPRYYSQHSRRSSISSSRTGSLPPSYQLPPSYRSLYNSSRNRTKGPTPKKGERRKKSPEEKKSRRRRRSRSDKSSKRKERS